MKLLWVFIILNIFKTIRGYNSNAYNEEYCDPNDDGHHLMLLEGVFTKLHKLLQETEKTNQNVLDLNKRFDELSTRQNTQEELIRLSISHGQNLTLSLQRQDSNLNMLLLESTNNTQHFLDLNKRQNTQEELVRRSISHGQNLTLSLQLLLLESTNNTQHVVDLHKRFDDLSTRQNTQEELIRKSFNHSQKWTPILRRQDGTVNFYRNWDEYRKGFGNSSAEFFIGLENLHILTTYGPPQELLVVLVYFDGETRYAKYDHFQIGNQAEKFRLKELGKYDGNAGDSLIYHKGMNFSTYDQDNDPSVTGNCAKGYSGAWWYDKCYKSHLTGPYKAQNESDDMGIAWKYVKGKHPSAKFAEMLIRPRL